MRDAEEWARIWNATATLPSVPRELAALITAARREGAEDMRERAVKACNVDAPMPPRPRFDRGFFVARNGCIRRIRALPLPGDE